MCSFFAIGRTQASFGSYLVGRLGWMALISVVLTGLTVLAARWVVGRSLRPVDRMRRELDEIAATDRKQPQLPSRPGCRQRRGLPGWVAWPNVRLLRHDGDYIVDLTGSFFSIGTYGALSPARLLDTRN